MRRPHTSYHQIYKCTCTHTLFYFFYPSRLRPEPPPMFMMSPPLTPSILSLSSTSLSAAQVFFNLCDLLKTFFFSNPPPELNYLNEWSILALSISSPLSPLLCPGFCSHYSTKIGPAEDTKGLLVAKSSGPLQVLILFDLLAAFNTPSLLLGILSSLNSPSSLSLALPLDVASSALNSTASHTLLGEVMCCHGSLPLYMLASHKSVSQTQHN